ncbi:hypothetical protein B7P43_G08050 [Cryptotermes secundus]|uniref:Alpha-1,3-mannosyl-glycoprotein 2-beta-N-acetylglucosaminyltransferase n=1 Tax=Cryptotermes secundus TaxID=105785 RepID=A0A2J7R7W3_9NEOP|nr:hypothetical protein B7P43_G08050 [Cryptotermes secundus]
MNNSDEIPLCVILCSLLSRPLSGVPEGECYFSQTKRLLEEDETLYCISAWNDQGYEYTSSDPSLNWDWDMWMRLPEVQKGRECVIPDVPQTYHFGALGLNMNSYFQDVCFKKHSFNTLSYVKLKHVDSLKTGNVLKKYPELKTQGFRNELHEFISFHFIHLPDMLTPITLFCKLFQCFKICDLDVRGYHKSMWRLHMKGSELLVVGLPYSEYS